MPQRFRAGIAARNLWTPATRKGTRVSEQVDRLVEIMSQLRAHCAWTAALTHESLVHFLLEESYELTDAIESGADDAALAEELGDILLQVTLHAAIGAERGSFDFDSIAAGLSAKMVRRNTHIFNPDGSLKDSFPESIEEIIESWDRAKRAEKPQNESAGRRPSGESPGPALRPKIPLPHPAPCRVGRRRGGAPTAFCPPREPVGKRGPG